MELNTNRSIQQLNSGEVDLIITSKLLDSYKHVQRVCYQEKLILVIPKEFPINQRLRRCRRLTEEELHHIPDGIPRREKVSLAELASTPFILLRNTNFLRECTDLLFRESNCQLQVVLEVDQSAISYNFAGLGIGATILSSELIEPSPKNDALYFYLIDSEFTTRQTYVAYSKNRHMTFAMKRMVEMLTEEQA